MSKKNIIIASSASLVMGIAMGFFTHKQLYNKVDPVYATYPGGTIDNDEAIVSVRGEVEGYKIAIANAKKRAVLERARQHVLEAEAAKKKLTADQYLAEIRKEHEKEKVTEEELKKYVSNQGLEFDKITPAQKDIFMKTIKNSKLMAKQTEYMNSLVNEKDIKVKVTE
jgi:hypothetical protein